ncbi:MULTISPECIES: S-layer homology domain-containing protein [Planktothricoides]|uniref:S-layer homology domain-containing protein n=2 Tax=Planktothricoides raciborskii TaxID=132608 RepID=A0AAU8JIC6_9CYAN|nr:MULTISPECIES: S-layer homology domain-containing protein [Planktothricoides]KOR36439.1 S-layer protein [Planktothricoides sp. SR001]MBD2546491.1 S-layer homology domain-containing protein [Planktothricoides raciborskii FACHB-1370]MBD2584160.1 S-layer homology domain-containing protein [Planktothricoides raciborskii FACHB-1261]
MKRLLTILSLTLILQMPTLVNAEEFSHVEKVVSAGLMTKDPTGNFNSNRILSRAELASLLVRTFELDNRQALVSTNDFTLRDVPSSHWAYRDIQIVLKTGVMNGYRDGMFFPNQRVNRAEGLAILAQAYGVFQFPQNNINELLAKYPDAGQIPDWARKSIATAIYEGFVNIGPNNQIKPLEPMTRGDMAYALSQYLERQEGNPAPIPWDQ